MPVVEDYFAGKAGETSAALLHAEEAGDKVQHRWTDVAGKVGEEAEKEAGRAVKKDNFGTEVEIGVFRLRLAVSLSHELDHVWKIKLAIDGFVHHVEECRVQGEIVRLLEKEIAAREGSVGFEFLRGSIRTLDGLNDGCDLHCVHQCQVLPRAETTW